MTFYRGRLDLLFAVGSWSEGLMTYDLPDLDLLRRFGWRFARLALEFFSGLGLLQAPQGRGLVSWMLEVGIAAAFIAGGAMGGSEAGLKACSACSSQVSSC